MNFLNILLVGGVAAGAIPIIVHLISRSKPREVRWGAMHLIEMTLQKQQRRLRIENWLLLLLRICIPVLLALCMARPVLTGAAALWNDAKTSLVGGQGRQQGRGLDCGSDSGFVHERLGNPDGSTDGSTVRNDLANREQSIICGSARNFDTISVRKVRQATRGGGDGVVCAVENQIIDPLDNGRYIDIKGTFLR